jgi:PAS domain S-box-containing protein/TyrR family helix-turn-helix protein
MKIREIMTADPITLQPHYTLQQVAEIFMENKIDGAPVVDKNNKLIGLITKSHIYRITTKGISLKVPVEAIMKREVLTAHPDDEFQDVVTPMIPRLPIVDRNGIVVGILTRGDIANAFFDSYQNISSEFDAIINSTYNMIISIDKKGNITACNRSAEKLLETRKEEIIGKFILDVLPNSGLMDIIKTGKVMSLQKIEINGKVLLSNRSPIIKNNKIIGAVAVLQDISEFEKITQELKSVKELNEELNAIIESSYDGLYITDGQGITLRLNKSYEMLSGINAHEFIGKNVDHIEKEGIVSESVTKLVLKRKEPVTVIQKTKVGNTTLTTGNPVFDDDGNIIRVVANVRDITELNMLKKKLEQAQSLSQHFESQLRSLQLRYSSENRIIFNSAAMKKLMTMVIRLAEVDSTILITGESGTGKELVAEAIYSNSARRRGPFIKVNCGAIPENLLESELFGYDAGAFTGAKKEGKPGYFELASGGTLFLDEIAELPLNLQVKLLRVIQNREITRIGGVNSFKVDVRIVTATNRDLLEMVRKKEFREDLYYRLNVVPLHVSPLRERKDDIPNLTAHFIKVFNKKYENTKRILPEVIDILMKYDWPGNVRELENLIERLIVITPGDVITSKDLPESFNNLTGKKDSSITVSEIVPLKDAVEFVEKQILEKAYQLYPTTRQMARELKVDASTIVRKAYKYGISKRKTVPR